MTMQMTRAFHPKMMRRLTVYLVQEGYYDPDNVWVRGSTSKASIRGVLTTGNKYSESAKGVALQNEVGGKRFSEYKTLYVVNRFKLNVGDKVEHNGNFYNILQMSDESIWGFRGYLLEKSKGWKP